MSSFRIAVASVLVFSTVLLTGCGSGPKRQKVSGTVTYKGVPIPNGSVTFLNGQKIAVGGAPIKDGVFEIPAASGLLAGSYLVSVSYPDPKGMPPAPKEGEAPGAGAESVDPRAVKDLLPTKYNRETGLTADIKDGEKNDLTFDLK